MNGSSVMRSARRLVLTDAWQPVLVSVGLAVVVGVGTALVFGLPVVRISVHLLVVSGIVAGFLSSRTGLGVAGLGCRVGAIGWVVIFAVLVFLWMFFGDADWVVVEVTPFVFVIISLYYVPATGVTAMLGSYVRRIVDRHPVMGRYDIPRY